MLRREYDAGLSAACVELDVGVLAYETLCRGILTGKWREMPRFDEGDLRHKDARFWGARWLRARSFVDVLERAADKVGLPPEALAIGWALRRPGVTAAVVGAKTAEQVRRNVRASAALEGHDRLWAVIDRIADAYD
jgi:aryl-alcohol dehydrogenase-like predicted oxidoreductase